jgi:hypothetical protein
MTRVMPTPEHEVADYDQLRGRILDLHGPGPTHEMYKVPLCRECGHLWPCASARACGLPTPVPYTQPEPSKPWHLCRTQGCEAERWNREGSGVLLHCEAHTCSATVYGGQCRNPRKGNSTFCGYHIWRNRKQLFTATVDA